MLCCNTLFFPSAASLQLQESDKFLFAVCTTLKFFCCSYAT